MSIDYLFELERQIDGGKVVYACPGTVRNQWLIAKTSEELKRPAQKAADTQKLAVQIVQLVSSSEAVAGDTFLVPIEVGDPGVRGEPQVKWKVVETREAADMFKDVRKGAPPFFAMKLIEDLKPSVG